ncbi:chitin synthase chs-2-like [Mercenaria mercenaria]|uniref:chitin synthase chs-2-like n=1 Tax=Mercenaria mercenaria TaxID=6596 RepID=UPI00234F99C7|nr:chitin synthase chs-2-like [Mercenaria mercenaria]
MYFFTITATEEDVFILTTDGDVKFTSNSIAFLLDLMVRDDSVGAVCARTFTLGNGPVVWYQDFEYAIGHWFQKAAEHVIGSVLCSPGCFSVYRCKAIREVLTTYASNVNRATDFLTKDMGEDRWLCTLMVQAGRRIEYCAASENSTHCPETFDEFFKQRRRWVVSTLANMMLLLQQWTYVYKYNHRVSFLFLVYQAVLLFATLIGPSSVVLVICGKIHSGLKYSWNWNPVLTLLLQLMICVGFTIICLITSTKTQLTVAKILTFLYAVVMTAVAVGTALQISNDVNGLPGAEANCQNLDSLNNLRIDLEWESVAYLLKIANFPNKKEMSHYSDRYKKIK